jgi:hypothetical protein
VCRFGDSRISRKKDEKRVCVIRKKDEARNVEGMNRRQTKIKMRIKYADGTARNTSDNRDDIINCLEMDLPDGYVIYSGLVWDSEEDSENDDGQKAVAEILNDDGTRNSDFE